MSTPATIYGSIVVGTDGSSRAGVAVQEALALAKATGAKLHLVQVVEPGVSTRFANDYSGQLAVDAKLEGVDNVSKGLLDAAEREGVPSEIHTPTGNPADALIEVAEATDADLIVVGNRGMSGAKRFVLGSVPNSVSHKSPCSVLIVNTDRSESEI